MLLGRTGLVFNGSTYRPFAVESYGYRCRGCYTGLNGNTPADQYQATTEPTSISLHSRPVFSTPPSTD